MSAPFDPAPVTAPPKGRRVRKDSAAVASRKLRASVEAWFGDAAEWLQLPPEDRATTPGPVFAIKGDAGLGKSTAVLDVLASPFWQTKRVLYLVPTLKLAEELEAKALALGINARVLRGRSQVLAGHDETDPEAPRMCAKWKLAEDLAALRCDIKSSLCFRQGEDEFTGRAPKLDTSGMTKEAAKAAKAQAKEEARQRREAAEAKRAAGAEWCPFARDAAGNVVCPHLAQSQDRRPGLLIAAHQYLTLEMEGVNAETVDVRVVDESYWQSLCVGRPARVSMERFRTPRGLPLPQPRKGEPQAVWAARCADMAARNAERERDFHAILDKALDALALDQGQVLTLDHFRAVGLTPEECRFAKGYEYSRLEKPAISPGMDAEAQRDVIGKAKLSEVHAFARVWDVLAHELETTRSQAHGIRRQLGWWNENAQQLENVLWLHYSRSPKMEGVPTLILDADLDEGITRRFFPTLAGVAEIRAEWTACRVTQVVDRAVSKAMLATKSQRAEEINRSWNRREDLWTMALDMAVRHGNPLAFSPDPAQDREARDRRPLLLSFKDVEDHWQQEGRIEDAKALHQPKRNALPFAVSHANGVRGKDCWKWASGIIVAGRLEPTARDVEHLARAVFFADPDPLAFLPEDERGRVPYPTKPDAITRRDGTDEAVEVVYHPDPRCHAVLMQIREAEISQQLARIRPIHRDPRSPCEIILATSVPIPGLLVDRTTTWEDLAPSRWRRMELAGVVPDMAPDTWQAFRELFASAGAAKEAIRTAPAGSRLQDRFPEATVATCEDGRAFVRVTYRRKGAEGERARQRGAFVLAQPGEGEADIVARLLAFLPDAFDVQIAAALPEQRPAEDVTDAEVEAGLDDLAQLDGAEVDAETEGVNILDDQPAVVPDDFDDLAAILAAEWLRDDYGDGGGPPDEEFWGEPT